MNTTQAPLNDMEKILEPYKNLTPAEMIEHRTKDGIEPGTHAWEEIQTRIEFKLKMDKPVTKVRIVERRV